MNLFELFIKIAVDDQASDKLKDIGEKLGNGLKTAAKIGLSAIGAVSTALLGLTTLSVNSFAEYEQLAGGAQKIFNDMDYSKIQKDAQSAYKTMNISANEYLAIMNDVGATFAATMGDEKGYEAAKTGLKAISDYASGTGKNVGNLSEKFTLITRSTSSYQSIADQFSGILPATSAGFLEQAQAAGILSDSYTELSQVPLDEYQYAVSQMLEKGVKDLGLYDNAVNESFSTLSGSLAMARGAWSNLITGIADDTADMDMLIDNFVESVGAVAKNLIPKIRTALNGASKLIDSLVPAIIEQIPNLIEESLPLLAESAVGIVESLIDGISENQEMLFEVIFGVITYISESLISMLPEIVRLGLDILVSLANGIAASIQTLAPTIVDVVLQIVDTLTDPETLSELFGAALEIIEALANALLDPEVLEDLVGACVDLIVSITDFLISNVSLLIDAAISIIEALCSALLTEEMLGKLFDAAVQILTEIGSAIIDNASNLLSAAGEIVGAITGFIEDGDWEGLGKYIIEGIADGLINNKSVFASVLKGVIGLPGIGIGSDIAGIALDGSHRNGLDYVPFDGYIAELHKGEQVLTKEEAYDYRNKNKPVSIVQNIYSEAKTAADLMQEALYQQERAVYMGV